MNVIGKDSAKLISGGMILALLHAAVLLMDTYSPFTWIELLIPFTAHEHPFWYGLGTLSMYGMLALMLSSDMRPKIKRPLWLAIHMLSYPVYLIAMLHGIKAGTDSEHPLIAAMYILTLLITLGLACGRMYWRSFSKARQPQQRAGKTVN